MAFPKHHLRNCPRGRLLPRTVEPRERGEAASGEEQSAAAAVRLRSVAEFQGGAAEVYEPYATQFKSRFKWLRPTLFASSLAKHLHADSESLISVLDACGEWSAEKDAKSAAW